MRTESAAVSVSTQPAPRDRLLAALAFTSPSTKTDGYLDTRALRRLLAATQVLGSVDGKSDRYLDALCDRAFARMDAAEFAARPTATEGERPSAYEVIEKTQRSFEGTARAQFKRGS